MLIDRYRERDWLIDRSITSAANVIHTNGDFVLPPSPYSSLSLFPANSGSENSAPSSTRSYISYSIPHSHVCPFPSFHGLEVTYPLLSSDAILLYELMPPYISPWRDYVVSECYLAFSMGDPRGARTSHHVLLLDAVPTRSRFSLATALHCRVRCNASRNDTELKLGQLCHCIVGIYMYFAERDVTHSATIRSVAFVYFREIYYIPTYTYSVSQLWNNRIFHPMKYIYIVFAIYYNVHRFKFYSFLQTSKNIRYSKRYCSYNMIALYILFLYRVSSYVSVSTVWFGQS